MQKIEIMPGFTIEKNVCVVAGEIIIISYNNFMVTFKIGDDVDGLLTTMQAALRELQNMRPGDGQWLNKALEEQEG